MARFGKFFTSKNYRHAIVAYAGDPLLQDKYVSISGGVPADLEVGSVVALSSADPVHTILKGFALVFADGVDADAFRTEMVNDGYTLADIDTFALPTT